MLLHGKLSVFGWENQSFSEDKSVRMDYTGYI